MKRLPFFFSSLSFALVFLLNEGIAQVGVGTSTIDPSAQLEISSTTKGFLPPRLTSTQRNSISSPALGLLIYNLTTDQVEFYKKGTEALDANNTTTNQTTAANVGAYQSFTAVSNGKISSVEINLRNPATTNDSKARVQIYAGAGLSGTLLATSEEITPTSGYSFNKFTLSSLNLPVLTAGSIYTIYVVAIGSVSNFTWVSQSGSNVYAGGQMGIWHNSNEGFYPTFDMGFKINRVNPAWTAL